MARVTTPPIEQARSIFTDLGYTVSDDTEEAASGTSYPTDVNPARDPSGSEPTESETESGIETEFRATREWKEVRVTAVAGTAETPRSGTLRCFVTWREHASALRHQLQETDPEYEWAILGVSEDGEYEVTRAPPGIHEASS